MDKKQCILVLATLALFAVSNMAFAQSSITAGSQITPAEVAATLGTSPTSGQTQTLSQNGVETNAKVADPTRNADGTDINAYRVENQGDPLHLINCNGNLNTVKTYNSDDKVWLVPYQTVTINHLAKREVRCATSTCWVNVNGVWSSGVISGYHVVIGGTIKPTNLTSYTRGCAAYIPGVKE